MWTLLRSSLVRVGDLAPKNCPQAISSMMQIRPQTCLNVPSIQSMMIPVRGYPTATNRRISVKKHRTSRDIHEALRKAERRHRKVFLRQQNAQDIVEYFRSADELQHVKKLLETTT
eukprot:TRINITY_DN10709_c0_g1_i2.p1 TRINITY_DN10709_c0_g1~~TRINITY_DN10709_c0_g1_i2.p1  ORF type:complete len:116 (-),score=8.43 TRINITY_DN10709_c0_g1_i2:16-363(-)